MKKHIISVAACLLFGSVPATGACQNIGATMMQSRMHEAIARPLPSFAEVIGAEFISPPTPIVVIGFFDNSGAQGLDWGAAISTALTNSADGAFPELSIIPSYHYKWDSLSNSGQGQSRRSALLLAAKRTGAKYGITGRVFVAEQEFELTIELLEFPKAEIKQSATKRGQLSALPGTLHELATAFFSAAVVGSTGAPTTGTMPPQRLTELESLAKLFGKSKTMDRESRMLASEQLWRGDPQSTSLLIEYLLSFQLPRDSEKLESVLRPISSKAVDQNAAMIWAQLQRSQYSETGIDSSAILKLTQTVRSNQANLGALFALSAAYKSEKVMYKDDAKGARYIISGPVDHHAGYANAIALSLEQLRRYPDHYRSWWQLSDSVHRYAALVRGAGYRDQISEATWARYLAIMRVAEDCLFNALRRNPENAEIHANMIEFDVMAGRDWMASFRKAAEIAPNWRGLYQQAFNYARPQWGGSKDDMREIYATAQKNNPNEVWPTELRDEWAPEISSWFDLDSIWLRAAVALSIVCLLFAIWRFTKHRRVAGSRAADID
jgi:hypothetical protein